MYCWIPFEKGLLSLVPGRPFEDLEQRGQLMTIDTILAIGIDEKEQLFIKPDKERFTLIYRTATEIHWDKNRAVSIFIKTKPCRTALQVTRVFRNPKINFDTDAELIIIMPPTSLKSDFSF